MIDDLKSDSTDRQVVLTSDGDTRGAWDRVWLAQVVASLLNHALGECLPGAPVQIAVRQASNAVALAVHHVGSPLTERQIRALFDPSPSHEPRAPGSGPKCVGLGLFLSRRIVEAHGGSIRAESDAVLGTTLTAELPRAGASEIVARPVIT